MKKPDKPIHTAPRGAGSFAGRMLTVAAVILVVTALSGWIESGTLTARAAVVLMPKKRRTHGTAARSMI